MTHSMTAFANSETVFENLTINCELRSVNHRYCDISLKIPERFRFAEAEMHRSISQKLKRGKIECSLSYKKQQQTQQALSVDMQAVQALLTTTQAIEQLMAKPASFSSLDVLAFPGIQVEPENDKAALQHTLQLLVKTATDNLLAARQREGMQLAQLITQRCDKMQQLVSQAKKRLPVVLEQLRTKLRNNIAELVADPDYDRVE
ncbi:MAG: hypothetical protein GQ583_07055, partial [Methyloprofundus sp.]|nr:hypothetical protein [Methyloprofundus sp.]